ncbi:hypothetical protein DIPPA_10677 [Diplonema papillatum]|nr:hypothetical protein DIPPA_10677 [Diplonema papillatum]
MFIPQTAYRPYSMAQLVIPMTEDAVPTKCSLHRNPSARGPSPELFYEALVARADDSGEVANTWRDLRFSAYDPLVLKLPVEVQSGDTVAFDISYFEPMVYVSDVFTFRITVPLGGTTGCDNSMADDLQDVTSGWGASLAEPMQLAMKTLDKMRRDALPFIFLITDGSAHDGAAVVKACVRNYEDLARKGTANAPRIMTLAIGREANTCFTTMMATIGRGHALSAASSEKAAVLSRVERLVSLASGPLVTNIVATDRYGKPLDVAPYPIPDLTCGAAVMVCGWVPAGQVPDEVRFEGITRTGETFRAVASVQRTALPVSKIFAKRLRDDLVARAWIARKMRSRDAASLAKRAAAISIATGVPGGSTAMVLVTMTPTEHAGHVAKRDAAQSVKDKEQAAVFAAGMLLGVALSAGLAAPAARDPACGRCCNRADCCGGVCTGCEYSCGGCCCPDLPSCACDLPACACDLPGCACDPPACACGFGDCAGGDCGCGGCDLGGCDLALC